MLLWYKICHPSALPHTNPSHYPPLINKIYHVTTNMYCMFIHHHMGIQVMCMYLILEIIIKSHIPSNSNLYIIQHKFFVVIFKNYLILSNELLIMNDETESVFIASMVLTVRCGSVRKKSRCNEKQLIDCIMHILDHNIDFKTSLIIWHVWC